MIYFIDIDGTLTDSPVKDGRPIVTRVDKVRELLHDGHSVTLWSANGEKYVYNFIYDNQLMGTGIRGTAKPDVFVDDIPTLRDPTKHKIIPPGEFFK